MGADCPTDGDEGLGRNKASRKTVLEPDLPRQETGFKVGRQTSWRCWMRDLPTPKTEDTRFNSHCWFVGWFDDLLVCWFVGLFVDFYWFVCLFVCWLVGWLVDRSSCVVGSTLLTRDTG